MPPSIRRAYVDVPWGQVHLHETGAGPAPALVCLHATAYSGRTFLPFLPHAARGRRVVALDTPGYGGSDRPPAPATIEDYAAVLAEAARALEPGRPVDLFGYHTGAMLAVEMAAAHPELVRRLVLIGVPFFEGADNAIWARRLVHERRLAEDLGQFAERWDYLVAGRPAGVTLERGFSWFVDELRAVPDESWSHAALFRYDARPRLAAVRQPVLVVNPASALAEASRAAAGALPAATLVEMPDVANAVFDLAPERIAAAALRFLDAEAVEP